MSYLTKLVIAWLSGIVALALSAAADSELISKLTAADKARLENYETTRAAAIGEARAGGSAEDIALLDEALAGEILRVGDGFDPKGPWRCRTIKLGGLLPLTVYPSFKCRISEDGVGWRIEKTTGSQRTSGYFYDDTDTRLVYLGAGHYADEKPKGYGEDSERNQVAYAFRLSGDRIRLEFPKPQFESTFDILYLSR